MWRECRAQAVEGMRVLEEREGDPMHPYAREALEVIITIMRSALNEVIRLQAARLFLEFTAPRPRGNRRVTVETAERWLDLLTA
jgi:hypothetical protein